jgi:hypothetical protein
METCPSLPAPSEGALVKQLEQPGIFIAASFGGAIAAILADAAADQKLDFLGFKLDLTGAFGIAGSAFLLATFVLCQTSWRMADLLRNADDAKSAELLSALFTHSWSLNPFAYYGARRFAVAHAALGAGLLALAWWTMLIALEQLKSRWGEPGAYGYFLLYGYPAGGLISLASVAYVHRVVSRKMAALVAAGQPEWQSAREGFRATGIARLAYAALASVLGALALYAFTHIGA